MPVRINGLVRTWNCRCPSPPSTFLGVKLIDVIKEKTRRTNFSCVGVLVEVLGHELDALDKREYGYLRQSVHLDRVERVDALLQPREQLINPYKETFLDNMMDPEAGTHVWVYVPDDSFTGAATADFPILQSYLDICMRGCLDISPAFLQEFLSTTRGWHPTEILELQKERKDTLESAGIPNELHDPWLLGSWSDDRHDPIYVRADKEYSMEYARHLDAHMEEASLPLQKVRVRA